MEAQMTDRVITLADLWEVFIRHLFPIILIALLCMGLLAGYSVTLVEPKYNSTATLYVLKQDKTNDYVYTQSDFTLALNVVNDCTYMLKSHAVLDDVIKKLDLNMSYKELYDAISTANPENTRVLEVSVHTPSAEESKKIVDCVCSIASEKITKAMGMDQVNMYAEGTLENKPCNTIGLSTYAIIGIAAALLVYVIYLVAFMLDDRIKTEEDIQRYLGLSVLGEIPNSGDAKRRGRKYGGKYYQSHSAKGGKAK